MIHTIYCLLYATSIMASDLSAIQIERQQQIGQLFIGTFHGNQVTDKTQSLLHDAHVGHWILFSNLTDLTEPANVKLLLSDLSTCTQAANGFKPLIVVDQEGGRVSRLTGGFTQFPPPAEWSDPKQASMIGIEMGRELKAAGFSGTLAPVVDIAVPGTLPSFRQRMFGESPEQVIRMATAFLGGLHQSGSIGIIKHFPGHGAATVDSHAELPLLKSSLVELERRELQPFHALMRDADAIMVGHLLVPAGDPNQPASLSFFWMTELLRKQWEYKGVVVTDSLTMRGVLKGELKTFEQIAQAISASAQEAFLAGADLLIIGPLDQFKYELDLEQHADLNAALLRYVINDFYKATQSGKIPAKRVKASLERISRLNR